MRFTFQSTLAQSGKYRPDIDGLRALAVLPVIFFHAKVVGFSGGFVGVDVFYVISGYLITSLILNEQAAGKFSLRSFYERRVRRIFPAVFVTVFFCAVVAAIVFSPTDLAEFGKSMFAMTFFVSNVFFKRLGGGVGYFSRTSENQVLLHTWSLSVEEQFYLLFPTFLLLILLWAKSRTAQVMGAVALGSLAISAWAVYYKPVSAFYILIPRGWELLIGTLLAMKVAPGLKHRGVRELCSVAGLAMIAWAVVTFNSATKFPGLSALVPCIGTWLIIYAGESGPSVVKSVLSFGPLVFVGLISYSLYLWHWPLIVFARYFTVADLTGSQTAGVIFAAILIAFFSFEFIEAPFRGKGSVFNRKQIVWFGVTVSVVSAVAGFSFYLWHGLPGRYSPATASLIAANTARKSDYWEGCGNWKKEVHRVSDIDSCQLGPDSAQKIMFWGDSHVQQLYPLIKGFYDDGELHGKGVVTAISNSCAPAEHLNIIEPGFHCASFSHFAIERAEASDINTIYIGFYTWWSVHRQVCLSDGDQCIRSLSPDEARSAFLHELGDHIRKFKAEGKRVIVSLPFPIYDKAIPDLEIRNAVLARFGIAAAVPKDVTLPIIRSEILSLAQETRAEVFDPRRDLCNEDGCITNVNGLSIYIDSNHLAASQVGILEHNLRDTLEGQARRVANQYR